MTIQEYLDKNKKFISQRFFAKKLGIEPSTLQQIKKGNSMPSLLIAMRIHLASSKQITYEDILKPFIDKVREKHQLSYEDEFIITRHKSLEPLGNSKKDKNKIIEY